MDDKKFNRIRYLLFIKPNKRSYSKELLYMVYTIHIQNYIF